MKKEDMDQPKDETCETKQNQEFYSGLTKYGVMRQIYLRDEMPKLYLQMKAENKLLAHLMDTEKRARKLSEQLEQKLTKENPYTGGKESFLERLQYKEKILAAVDEIVREQLIYNKIT